MVFEPGAPILVNSTIARHAGNPIVFYRLFMKFKNAQKIGVGISQQQKISQWYWWKGGKLKKFIKARGKWAVHLDDGTKLSRILKTHFSYFSNSKISSVIVIRVLLQPSRTRGGGDG